MSCLLFALASYLLPVAVVLLGLGFPNAAVAVAAVGAVLVAGVLEEGAS